MLTTSRWALVQCLPNQRVGARQVPSWLSMRSRPTFKCQKMGLWIPETKNRNHFSWQHSTEMCSSLSSKLHPTRVPSQHITHPCFTRSTFCPTREISDCWNIFKLAHDICQSETVLRSGDLTKTLHLPFLCNENLPLELLKQSKASGHSYFCIF